MSTITEPVREIERPRRRSFQEALIQFELDMETNVGYAAAFLDEHKPGWWGRVTKPLEMGCIYNCVLGQAFGPRWWQRGQRGQRSGWARGMNFLRKRGYMDHPGVFSADSAAPYWRVEITRRRGGG